MRLFLFALTSFILLVFKANSQDKPNIILIMADDIGWECFSDYGGKDYQTPVLNKMAKEGLRFSNCFSTPICTTSRVKLMTGKYNFRNYTHFGYLHPKEKTFAHLLKDAGYATAIAGKWQLNGLSNRIDGYQDNQRPYQAGFDEYCLWQLTKEKRQGERFWSPLLEHNGKVLSKQDNQNLYGPDILSGFICDFIERKKDKPFFVYYPMVLVHDPFVPTPDTIGSQSKSHQANIPNHKDAKKNFVAMVQYMDKIIGKIIQKVDSIDQLENTIILFTADNGTHTRIRSQFNDIQFNGGKGSMHETGTHVPFYAYWKGKTPKGKVYSDLIDFTDFYATFAEAIGYELKNNDPKDGRSFYSRLLGQKGKPREWVFNHYQPYWNKKSGQFVRNENYKLYHNGNFYKVSEDILEKKKLNSDKTLKEKHQDDFKQLQSILKQAPPPPIEKGNARTPKKLRRIHPKHAFPN